MIAAEGWQEFLYPLGFLASIAFTVRFLIQWIASEMRGQSYVMRSFWKLSMAGNLLLFVHSFIQMQIHICLVQGCQALLAWRNLNLMAPEKEQVSFRTIVLGLVFLILFITSGFILQGHFLYDGQIQWLRSPITPWAQEQHPLNLVWHLIGTTGILLFSCRFFVQWWNAEKHKASVLNAGFWWLSLSGAVLMVLYFAKMHDPVNMIGPIFGIIPYLRNLVLLKRSEKSGLGG